MRGVQKRAALRVIEEENIDVVRHMLRLPVVVRIEVGVMKTVVKAVLKVAEEGRGAGAEVNDEGGEDETVLMIQNIP